MKTRLQRLRTSDGYLREATLEFSQGLTCIIGARGTCKSTIVETIRFLHDLEPDRIATLIDAERRETSGHGPRGLLRETLAGGTATCTIGVQDEHEHESQLRLERSVDSRGPRAYRDDVIDTGFVAHELPIEIYSQGDLLSIAENPGVRLQLIDRPHTRQILGIQRRLHEAQRRIEGLGADILALRQSIQEDRRGLAPLTELQEQLDTIDQERPTLDPRLEQERAEFEARERLLSKARVCCQSFAEVFPAELPRAPGERGVVDLKGELSNTEIDEATQLGEGLHRLADAAVVLEHRLEDARALVAGAQASLQSLEAAFEVRNERYRQLRRDQEALSVSLEQEDRIRAQLRRMVELRDDLAKRQERLDALLERRVEARKEVEACLDEIFALRLREIEQISEDLGRDIALEIVQGAQSGAYVDAIADLLQGTRLKRQREIATRMADLIPPSELVDIIEREGAVDLAQLANLEPSQASRITNHFVDNMPKVLALETIVFEDQLDITMNVEGEVRPIEQLSRGQMATALLPLVLRHADFPLIFDQPEDDLDNRFVFDELVARIRKLKQTRQLVFVTHNANIPVLGEADRVIVMSMANARLAASPQVGTVDEMRRPILDILEGGAVAFSERRKRYEGMV